MDWVRPKTAFAALSLDRLPATTSLRFLPLAAARPFLAIQESLASPSSTSFQPLRTTPLRRRNGDPGGCGPIVPGLTTTIEAAIRAAREKQKEPPNGYDRH
ncbi:hypothetical protein NKI47_34440, partial [Mesorhizobium sp. M0633]